MRTEAANRVMRMAAAGGLALALVMVPGGCGNRSTAQNNAFAPRVVAEASDSDRAALLERLKSLEGEWTMTAPDGQVHTAAVFAVGSAGSAIREVMFPGSDHEMTNMYHMDGRELVMTHYCAAGNQPRMRAKPGKTANQIEFEFADVTNLNAADEHFMGSMTLTFIDENTIRQDWRSYQTGQDQGVTSFELTRKR
jgi:hypothetical protein